MPFSRSRLTRDEFPVSCKRGVRVATVLKRRRQKEESLCVRRFQRDCGAKSSRRARIIAHSEERAAQGELRIEVIRSKLDRLLNRFERARVVMTNSKDDPKQDERIRRALVLNTFQVCPFR